MTLSEREWEEVWDRQNKADEMPGRAHPMIASLLARMPITGSEWPEADRLRWGNAMSAIIDLLYLDTARDQAHRSLAELQAEPATTISGEIPQPQVRDPDQGDLPLMPSEQDITYDFGLDTQGEPIAQAPSPNWREKMGLK